MSPEDFPRPPNRRGVTAPGSPRRVRNRHESFSPPNTPPSFARKQKSPQSLNLDTRPSYPETFFEDTTPVEPSRPSESGDEPDPHDLALSPKHITRTSVVDNMLLSLDQFVPGSPLFPEARFFGGPPESDRYSDSRFPDSGRLRGHTYSSSTSSGPYQEEICDYPSIPRSAGSRSNNGSAFQMSQRHYDTIRAAETASAGYRSRNYESPEVPRVKHPYSGHSTRQQSIDSVSSTDYDPTIGENVIEYNERTSDSLDYDPATDSRLSTEDMEAAPTPTVPPGPRRDLPHDLAGIPANFPPPRTPALSRRNSNKSSKSVATRKGHSEPLGTSTIRNKELAPPLPSNVNDSTAPSPAVSYQKPAPTPAESPQVKEKPGFFRRVFGGSSKTAPEPSPPIESAKTPTKPSVTSNNQPRQDVSHPVVSKKPSFFRRRKKSVVDHTPPPLILAPNTLKALDMQGQPSPASSLRQVMDPYLGESMPSPLLRDSQDQQDESPRSFGRRGTVDSDTSFPGDPPPRNTARLTHTADGAKKSALKNKNSLKLQAPSYDNGGTFLAGKSPAEASSKLDGQQDGRPKTSPTPRGTVDHSSNALGIDDKLPSKASKNLSSQLGTPGTSFLHSSATSSRGSLREDSSADPNMSASEISQYHTASNSPLTETPIITTESYHDKADGSPATMADATVGITDDQVTAADRNLAQKLFDDQEEITGNEPAASWLGSVDRATVRKAYMGLFNWTDMDILAALRSLCTKIALKGETQQVDRVLDALSTRWCECNPDHGFKAVDVVHTICYSLLLLNTDLHLADIESKMTRNQFVRNTLPTINRVASDAAPDGFETIKPNNPKSRGQLGAVYKSPTLPSSELMPSNEGESRSKRGSMLMEKSSSSGALVNTPFQGTIKAWEAQVEIVLKDFYNSIQKQRLPLYNAPTEPEGLAPPSATGNVLRRSPSVLSKSGSDIIPRGRPTDSRAAAGRWASKPRSKGRLYPSSTLGSSRTSLDDQSSIWSPSGSSTWSKYSLGKTLTSMSVDSFGSEYPRGGGYQQSIGFANALSHAIIREDSAHSIASYDDVETSAPLLEDETLELAGAPWAKEGSLKHKQHLEAVDKRAKDRNWNECFAVIQRGWLRLFSFNANSKSMRMKSKQRQNGGGVVVGGGNWMENAEEVWKFLLRQTIASALPPPGYSKSRPHVWALSLPTGAVHLFQVGTAEIVKEFVTTANYWSARLSKQPLVGGVSNMEYGWGDSVINSALVGMDRRSPTINSTGGTRPSIQSSIRSSLDQQTGSIRAKLPADRVHLSDWTPPQQTMSASNLTEPEQLNALQNYVKNVEDELQKHNELRSAMMLAFSPRHPNSTKAMSNWERKSSYLLREIVKFRTYIDCLQAAKTQREKLYASREEPAA
ncbi:PH and SEC7 domain-containing protein C11E3,11c [Talaromyces islandicus]|uniref:PH and SEC7 domain-containing protein C11E3,11c n=1 Tax=Talaromyces islandicus TaxID=28573 RepID=A0A0U1LJV0_TALIS|nr:PH and SEC7 domain-containing protein C11E3,11c [Talaromyces islandicus]